MFLDRTLRKFCFFVLLSLPGVRLEFEKREYLKGSEKVMYCLIKDRATPVSHGGGPYYIVY